MQAVDGSLDHLELVDHEVRDVVVVGLRVEVRLRVLGGCLLEDAGDR
ncbi:unannotated protein [freshwater metagenome]|uniref:Unannotated protein n=1 Tax=freshwater metagenome TaxID=449393 RepID=A0A6J7URX3_9ZZZZ